jgi:hypothetical protein
MASAPLRPGPVTVIYEDSVSPLPEATAQGSDLWLTLPDLASSTGWELKPEGVCRHEVCITLPEERAGDFLREHDGERRFNLAEFARYLDQPFVRDPERAIWSFGPWVTEWQSSLDSLLAPDFTLPDAAGVEHTLSSYRGSKVLLLFWASW